MKSNKQGKAPTNRQTQELEAMRRVAAYLLVYYKGLAKKPRKGQGIVC